METLLLIYAGCLAGRPSYRSEKPGKGSGMNFILTGVRILTESGEERRDIVLSNGSLVFDPALWPQGPMERREGKDLHLFPGFTDVHVHLREPGFSYKETMATGTRAAARGGFCCVCTMPNINPVPDSAETLEEQLALIRQHAVIRVKPFGAISRGQKGCELADLAGMADKVAGFSDDGRGVQREDFMMQAMRQVKNLNQVIAAHCEDESLLGGGYIHQGDYARLHGHVGNPSESEWRQVERDLRLAEETGCKYHVCHVSTKESVALIREAKRRGVDVTCETVPHYLVLDDSQLKEDGRFKMNPPIRGKEDREALIEGVLDGTVDMIATDHAPHSWEEKAKGLKGSLNGVVGLETAFPVLYTRLVRLGILSLRGLIALMSFRPNARFGFTPAEDYTLFDLGERETINPEHFLSMGKSTPFAGMEVYGKCLLTQCGGRTAWMDDTFFTGRGRREAVHLSD
jgi:dihydroorotase